MSTPPPAPRYGLALLAITIAGWGLNWPTVKLLLRDWPPFLARGVAGVTAACLLAAIALARRERLAVRPADLPALAVAAGTNVFAWMGLTTVAMVWLSVAEGALLVYTMPLWAVLLEWPLRGVRPGPTRVAALLLGLGGLLVLLGGRGGAPAGPGHATGVMLAIGAAILFAAGTVRGGRDLGLSPLAFTAWQVGLGCLPMLGLAALFERAAIRPLGPAAAAALAYMTLVPMGLCYLTWFAALRVVPAGIASITTLLTPVVGILAAAVTIGEAIGRRETLAVALTLGGVLLAIRGKTGAARP